MVVYPKNLRSVSNRQYMFGDFDKDGTKNIDDPKPFNPKVSKYPDHANNPEYYHKARYGGGEVLLSEELMAIEKHNNQRIPMLKRFLRENPRSFGRIKTVPSTMKKLRERYLSPRELTKEELRTKQVGLMDIAAASILTSNRKNAYRKASQVKRKYRYDSNQTDDYYKKPKASHYGIHYSLFNPRKPEIRIELQIKSRKMDKLDKLAHPFYKKGKVPKRFITKGKQLFKLGF